MMSDYYSHLAERVREQLGNLIESADVAFQELTITVGKDNLREVACSLRDDKNFACEELIDLCGVD
ncbi:MAG: NADH-quinone oxidoreductase subunit C, partial [Proteobacteria bacterium]|nr:NADH-quinone oxidoreductase subunit C [Pseudomonadota bacterium]